MTQLCVILLAIVTLGCGHYALVPGVALVLEAPAKLSIELDACETYDKVVNIGGKVGEGLAMINIALCVTDDPAPEVDAGFPSS